MECSEPDASFLCCNVVCDERRVESKVFRHPIFAYDETLVWPPANWKDICCWHCCHLCEKEPVPLPHERDARTNQYRVFGVFCSFSCAKKYLSEHAGWTAGGRAFLLEDMARELFGFTGDMIKAAPARHRLRMFGGDLEISDFRAEATSGFRSITLTPPFYTLPEVYERFHDKETGNWSVRNIKTPAPIAASSSSASPTLVTFSAPRPKKSDLPASEKTVNESMFGEFLKKSTRQQVGGAQSSSGTLSAFAKKK